MKKTQSLSLFSSLSKLKKYNCFYIIYIQIKSLHDRTTNNIEQKKLFVCLIQQQQQQQSQSQKQLFSNNK
jgi:hypothetical protein